MQQQLIFHPAPSREVQVWWANPANPDNPLSRFVGNEEAVRRLSRTLFTSFGHNAHLCRNNFGLFGPSSTGKTMLARLFADALQIPFVELSPDHIDSIQDVFDEIQKVLANHPSNLKLVPQNDGSFLLPPMVVFIDEVHTLAAKKRIASGLLKSIALNDRKMRTENGEVVSTDNVTWIVATTERDQIASMFSGAFINRFRQIILRLYSKDEIAEIVQRANPDFTPEVCRLVANYCSHVPREALDFCNEMREAYALNAGSWEEAAKTVADDIGIDEFGMTLKRRDILKLLGRGPISKDQLASFVGVEANELRSLVMPPLQAITPDQPIPLVTVTGKGYSITPAGLEELDKRGIANLGIEAIPEQSRETFELMRE